MNNSFDSLRSAIHEAVRDAFQFQLNEDRVVKFGGKVYPKFGQCVIMAGGSGSGKGFALNTYLPIDAKVIDVDAFKDLYTDLLNRPNSIVYRTDPRRAKDKETNGDMLYDVTNPEDTSALHYAVDDQGWKEMTHDNFFSPKSREIKITHTDKEGNPITRDHTRERLPNVILDTTGKNISELIEQSTRAKRLGYETHLVWVVTSRDSAIRQALGRERQVSQSLFHDIHNKIMDKLPPFLFGEAGYYFDHAWLIFNSGVGLAPKTPEADLNTCVELRKQGNQFKINHSDLFRLQSILGPKEENPKQPTTYKDFNQVAPKNDDYFKPLSPEKEQSALRHGRTPKPIRRNHTLDQYGRGVTQAGDHLRN